MRSIPSSSRPCGGVFECTGLDIWRSMPFLLYSSRELLRIRTSGWHLFTPSWWGSGIDTLLSSNVHFPQRTSHIQTQCVHTHWPSEFITTTGSPWLTPDGTPTWSPARHACMCSKTHTHTKLSLSPKASRCIELSQSASWHPKEENRAHNAWRR